MVVTESSREGARTQAIAAHNGLLGNIAKAVKGGIAAARAKETEARRLAVQSAPTGVLASLTAPLPGSEARKIEGARKLVALLEKELELRQAVAHANLDLAEEKLAELGSVALATISDKGAADGLIRQIRELVDIARVTLEGETEPVNGRLEMVPEEQSHPGTLGSIDVKARRASQNAVANLIRDALVGTAGRPNGLIRRITDVAARADIFEPVITASAEVLATEAGLNFPAETGRAVIDQFDCTVIYNFLLAGKQPKTAAAVDRLYQAKATEKTDLFNPDNTHLQAEVSAEGEITTVDATLAQREHAVERYNAILRANTLIRSYNTASQSEVTATATVGSAEFNGVAKGIYASFLANLGEARGRIETALTTQRRHVQDLTESAANELLSQTEDLTPADREITTAEAASAVALIAQLPATANVTLEGESDVVVPELVNGVPDALGWAIGRMDRKGCSSDHYKHAIAILEAAEDVINAAPFTAPSAAAGSHPDKRTISNQLENRLAAAEARERVAELTADNFLSWGSHTVNLQTAAADLARRAETVRAAIADGRIDFLDFSAMDVLNGDLVNVLRVLTTLPTLTAGNVPATDLAIRNLIAETLGTLAAINGGDTNNDGPEINTRWFNLVTRNAELMAALRANEIVQQHMHAVLTSTLARGRWAYPPEIIRRFEEAVKPVEAPAREGASAGVAPTPPTEEAGDREESGGGRGREAFAETPFGVADGEEVVLEMPSGEEALGEEGESVPTGSLPVRTREVRHLAGDVPTTNVTGVARLAAATDLAVRDALTDPLPTNPQPDDYEGLASRAENLRVRREALVARRDFLAQKFQENIAPIIERLSAASGAAQQKSDAAFDAQIGAARRKLSPLRTKLRRAQRLEEVNHALATLVEDLPQQETNARRIIDVIEAQARDIHRSLLHALTSTPPQPVAIEEGDPFAEQKTAVNSYATWHAETYTAQKAALEREQGQLLGQLKGQSSRSSENVQHRIDAVDAEIRRLSDEKEAARFSIGTGLEFALLSNQTIAKGDRAYRFNPRVQQHRHTQMAEALDSEIDAIGLKLAEIGRVQTQIQEQAIQSARGENAAERRAAFGAHAVQQRSALDRAIAEMDAGRAADFTAQPFDESPFDFAPKEAGLREAFSTAKGEGIRKEQLHQEAIASMYAQARARDSEFSKADAYAFLMLQAEMEEFDRTRRIELNQLREAPANEVPEVVFKKHANYLHRIALRALATQLFNYFQKFVISPLATIGRQADVASRAIEDRVAAVGELRTSVFLAAAHIPDATTAQDAIEKAIANQLAIEVEGLNAPFKGSDDNPFPVFNTKSLRELALIVENINLLSVLQRRRIQTFIDNHSAQLIAIAHSPSDRAGIARAILIHRGIEAPNGRDTAVAPVETAFATVAAEPLVDGGGTES
ncbi:MAG: hypothetical protein WC901_01280 [Candidatus Margulisiibacteriota bacterium]